MALTKVSNSMQSSAPVSVKDYGAVGDGVTDDTAAINAATASGALNVYLPSGTYKVTGTLLVYPSQRVYGDGQGRTVINSTLSGTAGLANYLPVVAACDANGAWAFTGRVGTSNNSVKGFTVNNTGSYSIGLLWAGVINGQINDVETHGNESTIAGSRTSIGIVVSGLDTASTPRGNYYNQIDNITSCYQKYTLIYGNRAHSNRPINGAFLHTSDVGVAQDDGTLFSFGTSIAAPASMTFVHPDIEVIDGDAFSNLIGSQVSVYSGYFDTIGGDVFDVQGTKLEYSHPYTTAITGNLVSLTSGTAHALGYYPTDVVPYPARTRQTAHALEIPGFYGSSGAITTAANPMLLTGTVVITGTGATTANGAVTFTNYTDLQSTIYNAAVFVQVVSTAGGGSNNAFYSAGFSGLSNPDTTFTIHVTRVDGATFSEAVTVRWFVIAYTA